MPDDREEFVWPNWYPEEHPQRVNYKIWSEYTPEKLELMDGEALWGGEQRDNMLMLLAFNTGLEHFIDMLPAESAEILKDIIANR